MIVSGSVDRYRLFLEGGGYLFKNKTRAIDIVDILDNVMLMIQKKVNMILIRLQILSVHFAAKRKKTHLNVPNQQRYSY